MSTPNDTKNNLRSLDDIEKELIEKQLLTQTESAEIKRRAAAEVEALRALQESLSQQIARYMAMEGIGFNELTRRLGVSPRQTSKLVKGDGNFTLASIAEIAALMGKTARITFDEV